MSSKFQVASSKLKATGVFLTLNLQLGTLNSSLFLTVVLDRASEGEGEFAGVSIAFEVFEPEVEACHVSVGRVARVASEVAEVM